MELGPEDVPLLERCPHFRHHTQYVSTCVQTDQDDLSQEDDSVNRVASMITTLQYQACTSPVCEVAVLNELATAVGHGFIDDELVSKVCTCIYVHVLILLQWNPSNEESFN